MMVRLGTLVLFLFCSNVMADQVVVTAYPSDGSFKFAWSGNEAVYRDKTTYLRCTFSGNTDGIDNIAEPYIVNAFKCEGNMWIALKQWRKDKQASLLIMDKDFNPIGSSPVLIEKKSY